MKAEIVRFTGDGRVCEARTENRLLVVFTCPVRPTLQVGDTLVFGELAIDRDIAVRDPQGTEFMIRAEIHDLRLPIGHGTSRTPSEARLRGA
jgi:hypothetical protein